MDTAWFGAAGDNTRDDTDSIQQTLDRAYARGGVDVYLSGGQHKTTATLIVPPGVRLHGAGLGSALRPVNVAGPALLLDDDYGPGGASVEHIGIGGTADIALQVRKHTGCAVRDVRLLSGQFTDGFVFDQTYGSEFSRLYSNGPVITGKCFHAGQAFNANACRLWYSSNSGAEYNIYIGSIAEMPAANVFDNMVAQGGVTGLYVGQSFANTINAYYCENVIHPVVIGKYNTELARCLVMNSPNLGGGGGADPGRVVGVDIGYAESLEIIAPSFQCSNGIGLAAPIVFTGGGGSGAKAVGIVSPDGTLKAITVVDGGSGYTSDPAVSIGGAGASAAATAVRSGDTVASVTITNAGTGYDVAALVPIRYHWSVAGKIRFTACDMASVEVSPGIFSSAIWPWIVRTPTSPGVHGVNVENDSSIWTGEGAVAIARMENTPAGNHQHYISWRGSDGTPTGRIYTPPIYP
jgi:hypothetical protein